MEIFGIGPLELVFILLLVLIMLGPKDLQKTSKMLGRTLNKLVRSDTWKTITQTSKELRQLPTKLMREANLDEFKDSVDPFEVDHPSRGKAKDQFLEWSSPSPASKTTAGNDLSQENIIATPKDERTSE